MKRILTILILVTLVVTGCDSVVTGTPIPQPQKVDCDLVFPGPGAQ